MKLNEIKQLGDYNLTPPDYDDDRPEVADYMDDSYNVVIPEDRAREITTFYDIDGLSEVTLKSFEVNPTPQLTSTEGGPELHKGGFYHLESCPKLVVLDEMPDQHLKELILGNIVSLSSLHGITPSIHHLLLHNFYSIRGFSQVHTLFTRCDELTLEVEEEHKLKVGPILDILKIPNLKKLKSDAAPYQILSKFVPLTSMSDILRCRQELKNAGFAKFAEF